VIQPLIAQRLRITTLPSGERAAIIDSDIPEDAPPQLREGLARRAAVNAGGRCPCGATIALPNRAERRAAARAGTPLRVEVVHENNCPASTHNVIASAKRWEASR